MKKKSTGLVPVIPPVPLDTPTDLEQLDQAIASAKAPAERVQWMCQKLQALQLVHSALRWEQAELLWTLVNEQAPKSDKKLWQYSGAETLGDFYEQVGMSKDVATDLLSVWNLFYVDLGWPLKTLRWTGYSILKLAIPKVRRMLAAGEAIDEVKEFLVGTDKAPGATFQQVRDWLTEDRQPVRLEYRPGGSPGWGYYVLLDPQSGSELPVANLQFEDRLGTGGPWAQATAWAETELSKTRYGPKDLRLEEQPAVPQEKEAEEEEDIEIPEQGPEEREV